MRARRRGLVATAGGGLIMLAAGCALSPELTTQREAVATYNRCVIALKGANLAGYRNCLSTRHWEKRQAERFQDEATAPLDEQAWMHGLADSAPYVMQIEEAWVSPDLQTVTLKTLNRSGVLQEAVDHHETIVLVRENGRWVIDKDCCEYSNARFASPVSEGPPETVPLP